MVRLVTFSSVISPSSFISLRVGRTHILATPSTVRERRWSEREREEEEGIVYNNIDNAMSFSAGRA